MAGERVEDVLESEIAEMFGVVCRELTHAVMPQSVSETRIEDAASGDVRPSRVLPYTRHDGRAFDECPPRMAAKPLAQGRSVRGTQRLSKYGRVSEQHVQLDENELGNRDVRPAGTCLKEAASSHVLGTVAVQAEEQEIGVDGEHNRKINGRES